eukprot:948300-Amphidinium_carterae.1
MRSIQTLGTGVQHCTCYRFTRMPTWIAQAVLCTLFPFWRDDGNLSPHCLACEASVSASMPLATSTRAVAHGEPSAKHFHNPHPQPLRLTESTLQGK